MKWNEQFLRGYIYGNKKERTMNFDKKHQGKLYKEVVFELSLIKTFTLLLQPKPNKQLPELPSKEICLGGQIFIPETGLVIKIF